MSNGYGGGPWGPGGQGPGGQGQGPYGPPPGGYPPQGYGPQQGWGPHQGYGPGGPQGPYPPQYQPAFVYAGFWLRFVAWIIDVIVMAIAGNIILAVFGVDFSVIQQLGPNPSPAEIERAFEQVFGPGFWQAQGLSLLVNWLYFAALESSSWQGTLGKKALGLTVTDYDGRRIGFGQATGRFFAKILSGLILLIGYLMAGFTQRKQALHDMLASTLVVRRA